MLRLFCPKEKMSVDVKTPPKTKFEFPQVENKPFDAGNMSTAVTTTLCQDEVAQSTKVGSLPNGRAQSQLRVGNPLQDFGTTVPQPAKIKRRRYYSERGGDNRHGQYNPAKKQRYNDKGRREKIVLPTKFLLGGNINDPLNLNSLNNEEVNKLLNEKTPQSSPLPIPTHRRQQVQVLIPPNITDPLNLNSGEDIDINLLSPKGSNKKKRKSKNKKRNQSIVSETTTEEIEVTPVKDFSRPMHIIITPDWEQSGFEHSETQGLPRKIVDKIVSPAIPQVSPKSRKRKRTSSEGKSEPSSFVPKSLHREDSEKSSKSDKILPHGNKFKRQPSNQSIGAKSAHGSQPKFIYGNYNRYYGYRNPGVEDDSRLKCFKKEWFEGRDVLDIGCNIGHVTLSVARDYNPRKIIGMDIDSKLIAAARKNVRHYVSEDVAEANKFPLSMTVCYGPIAAPQVPDAKEVPTFPNNVAFIQGNYVLESDELLDLQHEEYDVILGLSITKWIHLNWGDAALKRTFRRIYKQLRPGGKFILEPQSWSSYKKKKKLTDTIFKNFLSIRLKPDQFTEYLLSREVGFSKCEKLDVPFNKSKGFQRPVQVFTKADTAQVTPRREQWSRDATPMLGIGESHGSTPRSVGTTASFIGGTTPDSKSATPSLYTEDSQESTLRSFSCNPLWSVPDSRGVTPIARESSESRLTPWTKEFPPIFPSLTDLKSAMPLQQGTTPPVMELGESQGGTPQFMVGSSGTLTPNSIASKSRSVSPGCPSGDETRDSGVINSNVVSPHSLQDLRTQSAPSLLETSAFMRTLPQGIGNITSQEHPSASVIEIEKERPQETKNIDEKMNTSMHKAHVAITETETDNQDADTIDAFRSRSRSLSESDRKVGTKNSH